MELGDRRSIEHFRTSFRLVRIRTVRVVGVTRNKFRRHLQHQFTVLFLRVFFRQSNIGTGTSQGIFVTHAIGCRTGALFVASVTEIGARAVSTMFHCFRHGTVIRISIDRRQRIGPLFSRFRHFYHIRHQCKSASSVDTGTFRHLSLVSHYFSVYHAHVNRKLCNSKDAVTGQRVPGMGAY